MNVATWALPVSDDSRARVRAGRCAALLGILGLLTYPLPTAWLGLLILVALPAVRWRFAGSPLPASAFAPWLLLYLMSATFGLALTFDPESGQVRFFGLLAAL